YPRTEFVGHALDERDHVAHIVRRAQVDGVAGPRGGVDLPGGLVLRIEKRLEGGHREVRVGDVAIAQRVARVPRRPELLPSFEPEREGGRDQPGRRRWELVDDQVSVGKADRIHPLRAMRREVLPRDQTVALLDGGRNGGGDLAPIEAVYPVPGEVAQRRGA